MDIRPLTRFGAAASLVLAPAAMLVTGIVSPVGDTDGMSAAEQLAKAAAHQGAMRAVLALDLVVLLVVPAVLALGRLARRGAPRLAVAGGWAAGTGWLAGLIGLLPLDALLYAGSRMPDRAGAAATVHGFEGNALVGTFTGLFVLGHIVGGVLLGFALWRSRAVPAYAGALVGITPLIHLAAHMAGSAVLDDAGAATMLAGFAICAARIVRMPDDAWDIAPATAASASGSTGEPVAESAIARP